MPASRPLSAAFLSGAGSEAADASDALETALVEALAAGRAAWPTVAIAEDVFSSYLGSRAALPLDSNQPLRGINVGDLYLACGCAKADSRALAACDPLLQREATLAAEATGIHASVRDEAIQVARTLLFMPRPERPPAIEDYAGRGPLRGWLRVMLSRELVRVAKRQNRHIELQEEMLESPEVDADPELQQLKARYRPELADAFRAALDALPVRDRTLLRHQMIDGLSIDEIAAIYRVHRATAARWLVKLRDDLVETTRTMLADKLGVDTEEAASIVRLVQSQVDVSVLRHLGPPPRQRR